MFIQILACLLAYKILSTIHLSSSMQANYLNLRVYYAEMSSQNSLVEKLPCELWAGGQTTFSRDSICLF